MLPGLVTTPMRIGHHITGVEVTPTMTGPTTPSGYTASASSQYDASAPAWKAFDKSLTEYPTGVWISGSEAFPKWVRLQFPSAVVVASYSITTRPGGDATQAPGDFTLQGSNNGTDWTTVDTRTGQTFSTSETKTYTVTSPMAFSYWRLHVTSTPHGSYCRVLELNLYG